MDTFAGIVQGGNDGALVTPGKPAASLLVQRITATGDERMPKNAAPLAGDEIKKISDWIAAGAKFTGTNATPIADLKAAGAAARQRAQAFTEPIQINKPTGTETVSFTNDIAPFMVNLCLNCHSGADPRSGFSLETFEKLMRGGKSGRVVLPGNTEDSRLWHLVGKQDPIKMPPAQAMITITNHAKLEIWIKEGAKFDGRDAKAPLRSLVPTEAEKRAKELAALSPDEFAKRRKERGSQLWSAALPNEPPVESETDAFLVIGNSPETRTKQIADWAGGSADRLRKLFNIKEPAIWRGKLIVFVFKDRFSYTEFAQTNENVQIPPDTKGHSRVSSAGDEAYICLLDIGDSPTDDSPGVRTLLFGLLGEALLHKLPNRVPDWAAKGTGLVLAAQGDPKNPYFRGLSAGAHEALRAINKPEELFANGTFSPADLAPVGFTLVSFMLKKGGEPYFVDFLNQTASGKSLNDALKAIYNVDTVNLARRRITHMSMDCRAQGCGQEEEIVPDVIIIGGGGKMRAVVQRVSRAQVSVAGETVGSIERGFLVFLGVAAGDTLDDALSLAQKIVALRVFEDDRGKMNLSLAQVGGKMLVVSQFTLLGDCRKGRRPSFDLAARPEVARDLYEGFVKAVCDLGVKTETGRFQEQMLVELTNDGPVTLLLDSRRAF